MTDNTGGLSGMAGFALGRMSAENDRVLMDAASAFRRRGQAEQTVSIADYNTLVEENARLRRNLAATREAFYKLEAMYDNQNDWANRATAVLKQNGLLRS